MKNTQTINYREINRCKKSEELKKIYNQFLDERKEILRKTQFKIKDMFGDIIEKDNITQDQIITLKSFLTKMMKIKE